MDFKQVTSHNTRKHVLLTIYTGFITKTSRTRINGAAKLKIQTVCLHFERGKCDDVKTKKSWQNA